VYLEVGEPHKINCTIYTINSDNVSNITWNGPNGTITNDDRNTTTFVNEPVNNINVYTSTLQFSNINEEDDGTSYDCTASLLNDKLQSKSISITTLDCKLISSCITCAFSYSSYVAMYVRM